MKRTGLIVVSEEEVVNALERVAILTAQIGNPRIRNMHRRPLDAWLRGLLDEITNDPPLVNK